MFCVNFKFPVSRSQTAESGGQHEACPSCISRKQPLILYSYRLLLTPTALGKRVHSDKSSLSSP